MNHLNYWKLKSSPFGPPQTVRDVMLSGTVDEAIRRCDFLISQRKQLGLLIGPGGSGKTTLLRQLIQTRFFLATDEHLCLLNFLGQSPLALTHQAVLQLDPDSPIGVHSIEEHLLRIHDMATSLRTVGHHTILLFDDAKMLTEPQLELFLRLSRIPGVTSILALDEEVLVDLPKWVVDYSDLRIELPAWDLELVAEYFDFAISGAGGDPEIFDAQAITRIQELSEGLPKRIAKIADLALALGAVRRSSHITVEIVEEVCDEFTLSLGAKFPVFWEGRQLNA